MYRKLGRHEWQTEYAELKQYEYCKTDEYFGSLPRRLFGLTKPRASDSWEETCGGKTDQRTLILGSGNSTLGEEMHDAGWTNITSIDFSEVAIEVARQRAPHMEWKSMDATELSKSFTPGSFDLVIDKGLLDSMHLVGDRGKEPIEKIALGVQKILAPGTGAMTAFLAFCCFTSTTRQTYLPDLVLFCVNTRRTVCMAVTERAQCVGCRTC